MDVYYILLILYFLIFFGLAIKNLKWAVYLIVFSLPSYLIRFEILGIPITVLEGMILLIFLVWLVKLKKQDLLNIKQQLLGNRNLIFFIGLFLLVATTSIFISPEFRVAAGIWKAYFIEPILFLIVLVSVLKKEDLKNILKVFGWSVLILSLVAIYQKITGNLIPNPFWAAEATRRVTSVFEYPNALALYIAPIVVILMGYLGSLNLKNKMLAGGYWLLVIILGLSAIYFSGSKGALLGILFGIIFYSIFYKTKRKYFIGLLIIAVILSVYLVGTQRVDIRGVGTVEGGDSITTRVEMWQETWQMLKSQPIMGAGLAGYQQVVEPYHQKDYIEIYLYPHNIILNFWSEVGILGLVAFLGILIWFYITGIRYKGVEIRYKYILMAGMTALLVHGLVDVPYFKNDLAILFWILIGGMILLSKDKFEKVGINKV